MNQSVTETDTDFVRQIKSAPTISKEPETILKKQLLTSRIEKHFLRATNIPHQTLNVAIANIENEKN